MTHLRKVMLEELERRNYTESTTRAYIRTIEDFARYFKRPPDQLGTEQIRAYVAHLFRDRKLTDNTVNQRVGALRFFFIKTLKKAWGVEETPYPKWSEPPKMRQQVKGTNTLNGARKWICPELFTAET